MINDRDIWHKFKDGDDNALHLIYTENSKKLYLYGLKLTPNRTVIEDAIQDLFSDLVRSRRRLGNTDNVKFYLLKSFKRRLVRQLQKEKRYLLKNTLEDYIFDISYSIEHETIIEENAQWKLKYLQQALHELTPRQKEAVYLRFTEELEYKEISEIMEMGIDSCRNLICKAIKSLKNSIQGNSNLVLFFLKRLI